VYHVFVKPYDKCETVEVRKILIPPDQTEEMKKVNMQAGIDSFVESSPLDFSLVFVTDLSIGKVNAILASLYY
jgi:hypothetical protein